MIGVLVMAASACTSAESGPLFSQAPEVPEVPPTDTTGFVMPPDGMSL